MSDVKKNSGLEEILKKAGGWHSLSRDEVLFLLDLESTGEIENLFAAARRLRAENFDNRVFLYGFIYFSTYCRNDCAFCYYRRSNREVNRYRKTEQQIVETAVKLAESGVHLLDLTMGEDPLYFSNDNFEELIALSGAVKETAGLPVMISPGVVPAAALKQFDNIGVDWYACYQETHNRELYEKLRLEQDFDERLAAKRDAHEMGMLIEEGLLVGLEETSSDIYSSFETMADLAADQIRVMSFVPQRGTPLESRPAQSPLKELKIIAIMRLLFPDRLIPASLDVEGLGGLKKRLDAGANVITSIIPPSGGLMGVSQSTLDIEEGARTVAGIMPVLEECSLKTGTVAEYQAWLEQAKSSLQTGASL